jgi:endonuclease/exonuclease/phosphatase family metal-dependent hydrolase
MEHVRVLTMNIWNRSGPWDKRLPALRTGLAALAADVVVLQEVLRLDSGAISQLDALAEGLYPHQAYAPAWTIDSGSGFTMGNAVLSRFPMIEREQVLLPNPRQHEARSLLYTLCETPHGQMPVLATHLDWQLELSAVRCQQVVFIVEQMEAWLGRAAQRAGARLLPAVLAGDFNAEPASDEIRFLRGYHALPSSSAGANGGALRGAYFNDCYAFCGGDERTGATFSCTNPYAATECEPERRIDYIFVRPAGRSRRGLPLRSWRCLDQPIDGVFPSDHFGVAADIQISAHE